MFGQFAQQHHMGANGKHAALGLAGTSDRSDHPDSLHLPQHAGGLPVLPAGMVNLSAKAGDILMIPEALVHGALPWLPTDRQRRVLVLRYRPHASLYIPTGPGGRMGSGGSFRARELPPNPMPAEVLRRLSPETVALTDNAPAEAYWKPISRARGGVTLTGTPRL